MLNVLKWLTGKHLQKSLTLSIIFLKFWLNFLFNCGCNKPILDTNVWGIEHLNYRQASLGKGIWSPQHGWTNVDHPNEITRQCVRGPVGCSRGIIMPKKRVQQIWDDFRPYRARYIHDWFILIHHFMGSKVTALDWLDRLNTAISCGNLIMQYKLLPNPWRKIWGILADGSVELQEGRCETAALCSSTQ